MIGPVGQREMEKSQLTLVSQNRVKSSSPLNQGFPLLRIVAMPVVDRRDPAFDMVEDLRDNQPGDPH